MSKIWLLCVLLGTLAWGQAAPSAPPPEQPAPGGPQAAMKPSNDSAASVPDDAAVITIKGVCAPEAKAAGTKAGTSAKPAERAPSADCKTIITKAEFEKMVSALAPTVTPQVKRQLAGVLPRFLALSEAAKKQGLDKTPQYAETLKFAKMQILATELQRKVQKEAADVPDSEIEKYYKDNPEAYEQYSLERIFVPRTKQGDNEAKVDDEKLNADEKKAKEEADKSKGQEAEQAMTKEADDIRERAAKGEDFTKLQKEAFEAAGMKIDSPTISLPSVRRTGLPPGHAAVFDLKAGEVSQVISDAGGHYIYKMVSKTEMPYEQAKNEIHNKMQNDRMKEKMDKLNGSFQTETNEAYFGAPVSGPVPPMHGQRPGPGGIGMRPVPQQTPPPAQPPAAKQD